MVDLAQQAMIESRRREFASEAGEIDCQVALDGCRQSLICVRLVSRCSSRLRKLGIDYSHRDRLLRVECRQTPGEVLKLADITRPAIAFEPIECGLIELLHRQAFALGLDEKMPDQIGHVF